ncbi:phage tail protein [Bacillus xiapuensis]|uniref:Phage tail family protein n=1 Tax=Bacillus xiapuensis TaxID=2014075 RepID=A0ABU6N7P1_9BACI|nr:phage tail family protein [Bacillus xiapuensis]
MIRESLYFTFAGIKSTEFGIWNVSISDGLYSEPFMASRSINEVKIRGRDKPYPFEVNKEPLSFQLSFLFSEGWDDELISKVQSWLDVDFYQPLSFSENLIKVYYAMPVDTSELTHNGIKQGYITLTMRCDSPYSYSRDIVSPWYKSVHINGGSFITPYLWSDNETKYDKSLEIINKGDKDILLEIFIEKNGDGDITVINTSRANSVMKFTSLLDGEKIHIDGENQIIESNLPNIWRYDDFNDFYLPLYKGKNVIQVEGDCLIKFQYRYKFIS